MGYKAKDSLKSIIIPVSKVEEFIRKSNKNVITKERLEECKRVSELFNRE